MSRGLLCTGAQDEKETLIWFGSHVSFYSVLLTMYQDDSNSYVCMCFLLSMSLLEDSSDDQELQVSLIVIILDYSVYLIFTCSNCQ